VKATNATLAAALTVTALHTAPALTTVPRLRRHLFPDLTGIGTADTVALTFDDGPDAASTPEFLRTLAELGVPATFFVLGSMAAKAPDLLCRIHEEGHEVGVHGWTHRNHLLLSPGRIYRELVMASDLVTATCGIRPRWFRPPYGVLSGGSCTAAARLGLRPLLWSAWGRDWEARATPDSVLARLRQGGLRGGATLLLHDSDCTSAPQAWRSALGALPAIVEECRRAGLRFVRVSEHLR
jgi:peptidoglycan/xylan/chitin deacetylase (PgdA/CDA1 family)